MKTQGYEKFKIDYTFSIHIDGKLHVRIMKEMERSGANVAIPSVEAVQARFGSLPLQQRLSGVVQAQKQVEIYPRISAPIENVIQAGW